MSGPENPDYNPRLADETDGSKFVDIDDARVLAEKTKEHYDNAASGRKRLQKIEQAFGKSRILEIGRRREQARVEEGELRASEIEATVMEDIDIYRQMKSSPDATALYEHALESADRLGEREVAFDLDKDFKASAAELATRDDPNREPLANLVEKIALHIPEDPLERMKVSTIKLLDDSEATCIDEARKALFLLGMEDQDVEKLIDELKQNGAFFISYDSGVAVRFLSMPRAERAPQDELYTYSRLWAIVSRDPDALTSEGREVT